jgi:hypothetical protein
MATPIRALKYTAKLNSRSAAEEKTASAKYMAKLNSRSAAEEKTASA